MADQNSFNCTGRLTRDPEMQHVGAKGTTIVKFGIANNTGFGQYERANFFDAQMWGNAAEAVFPYLKKGKQIALTGMLENQKWTNNEGVEKDKWVVTISTLTLLSDGGAKTHTEEPQNSDEVVF